MSRKIKMIGLCAVAVLAFSAVAASAAQAEGAARWKVGGAFLGAGATQAYTASLTGSATLAVPGLMTLTSSNCSATGKITGSAAGSPGGHKETVLSCEKISVEGAPACEVEPVVTNKMKGTLGWMESTGVSNVVTFEPEAGTLFTEVEIFECALEGFYPVTGGTVGTLTPAGEEVTEGVLHLGGSDATTTEHYFGAGTPRPTVTSPALKFGSRPSTFAGTLDVKLTSGQKAGIFAG